MDQIAAAAGPLDAQHAIAALHLENQVLKGVLAELNRRLLNEEQHLTDAHVELNLLRQANERLVRSACDADHARAATEAAAQRQTEFLSMLAHELRNPMASIAVANSVMRTLVIDHPRLPRLLAIVERQAAHLVRLVDDLLDASRITTGKISLRTCPLKLHEVIEGAIDIAHSALTAREQAVQVELPAAPLALEGDPVRLAQLFSNLLLNASKFSAPRQAIVVAASLRGDGVAVAVRDQGKGIAREDQPHIFDLFEQGRDERTHAWSGGLGIGLTLVRSIAQLHGGSVRVDSAGAGCGSQFTVVLPLRAPGPR
ncbi:sensor histidine kinase [Massilia sp. TWP1-3-3]|uniref:sensor histidine kinase n=1 Tax=Massilia sp. TWP1-3-3 TaxID=2804573 RepID=UPI003CF3D602